MKIEAIEILRNAGFKDKKLWSLEYKYNHIVSNGGQINSVVVPDGHEAAEFEMIAEFELNAALQKIVGALGRDKTANEFADRLFADKKNHFSIKE